jgi:Ca2+-transporting ATPase
VRVLPTRPRAHARRGRALHRLPRQPDLLADALEHGVLVVPAGLDGSLIQATPPLIVSDAELDAIVPRVAVYGRASPESKLRIIAAYQQRGEIVAMLGDGVNDAAALRKADIGVAMGGRGTDLAKESADVILEDDRFPTIGVAIEEGRVILENIRKFVVYLFSCNLAEILVLLGAGLAGYPAALAPLQILWLNLLTDTFPALALAVEQTSELLVAATDLHRRVAELHGAVTEPLVELERVLAKRGAHPDEADRPSHRS